jgi:glyoxylase-like metal-dependent hydrolase (beta-lactamase superfamily II)
MSMLWHYEDDQVRIRKLCVGAYENNVYVVADAASDAAVVVDAAAEADRILAAAADVAPIALLTTHGHFDHVGAAVEVSTSLGIPFSLHEADAPIAGIEPDRPLVEGEMAVGGLTLRVLHTPGHTPGSMCVVAGGAVLTGDTLFPGGPGATHGVAATFTEIIASIEHRLLTLDPALLVMPGHGLDTTIGAEKPSLEEWVRRGW